MPCVNLTAIPEGRWECMLHRCSYCSAEIGDERVQCHGSPGSESWRVEHPAGVLRCMFCPAGWCSRRCFNKAHHAETTDSVFVGSCITCGTAAAKKRRQVFFALFISCDTHKFDSAEICRFSASACHIDGPHYSYGEKVKSLLSHT